MSTIAKLMNHKNHKNDKNGVNNVNNMNVKMLSEEDIIIEEADIVDFEDYYVKEKLTSFRFQDNEYYEKELTEFAKQNFLAYKEKKIELDTIVEKFSNKYFRREVSEKRREKAKRLEKPYIKKDFLYVFQEIEEENKRVKKKEELKDEIQKFFNSVYLKYKNKRDILNIEIEAFCKKHNCEEYKLELIGDLNRLEYKKIEFEKKEKIKKILGRDDVKIPRNYNLEIFNNKVYLTYKDDKSFFYLCKAFTFTKKVSNENETYLEIKFADKIEKIYNAKDLTDNKTLTRIFASKAEILDRKKIDLILKYMGEFLRLNEDKIENFYAADRTGWHFNDTDFLLPSINKKEQKIAWINDTIKDRFDPDGSLDKQIELIKKIADKKIFIVVLFSLAAPLIKMIDNKKSLNYLFHIGGLTGSGKSLACKLGVSMWGEPRVESYGTNWNATLNGLESYLEKMKDVPSWIDEMELVKNSNYSLISQLIYMFVEGKGKTRAFVKNNEIMEREAKTFRGLLFTSGEKNIDEIINNVREENKKLGLNRRVLSYESDELWSDSGEEYQELIGDAIDENWGHFGIFWVEFLKKLGKEKLKKVFELEKKENNSNLKKLSGKEVVYYLMFVVLDVLLELKIIDDEVYKTQKALLMLKAEKDIKEHNKIINTFENFTEDFKDFVTMKKNNFITNQIDYEELKVDFYGVIESGRIWINKEIFKKFCIEKNYVIRQAIKTLEKNNCLISDKGRKDKRFSSNWGFGRPRFYCIVFSPLS